MECSQLVLEFSWYNSFMSRIRFKTQSDRDLFNRRNFLHFSHQTYLTRNIDSEKENIRPMPLNKFIS